MKSLESWDFSSGSRDGALNVGSYGSLLGHGKSEENKDNGEESNSGSCTHQPTEKQLELIPLSIHQPPPHDCLLSLRYLSRLLAEIESGREEIRVPVPTSSQEERNGHHQ
uniref:Uncharacterized protein n=1 Tax=Sphaerodactylus townsendi TaxID=933632 RepID=A0ACB8EZL2_9SAUR